MRVAEGPQPKPCHPNQTRNAPWLLLPSAVSVLVLIFSLFNRPNSYCSIKYNHLESSQVTHATSPPTTRSRKHPRHQLSHSQTMDLSRQTQNRQNSRRPSPRPRI